MPTKIQKVLDSVLSEIKPSLEVERDVKKHVDHVLHKLNKFLPDGRAILGGSGAKGTWLAGNYDVDIFVQFNYKKYVNKSEKLSSLLEKSLKKAFGKVDRFHGSRDYFQLKKNGFVFEFVPILAIRKAEDAMNITDISPLHALFVKKHKQYRDDIRLMKQFCRAAGVYGAESHINGFSGYVIEILVIHYKGFLNTLRAMKKWKGKPVIDTAKHFKTSQDVMRNLNISKTSNCLVIVDPVDAERNASAAVGDEKYAILVACANAFLKTPHVDYFKEIEFDISKLKEQYPKQNLIAIEATTRKGKPDVMGSKIIKVFSFLQSQLEEFEILDKGCIFDNKQTGHLWFVLKQKSLPKTITIEGPPLTMKEHVAIFKKKHKKTTTKKGKVVGTKNRKITSLKAVVKNSLSSSYVQERVKDVVLY